MGTAREILHEFFEKSQTEQAERLCITWTKGERKPALWKSVLLSLLALSLAFSMGLHYGKQQELKPILHAPVVEQQKKKASIAWHPLQEAGMVRKDTGSLVASPMSLPAGSNAHFASVAESAVPGLLQKLGNFPRVQAAELHALLKTIPAVHLAGTPREGDNALFIFTNLSCPACRSVEYVFEQQASHLRFPVFFLPVGSAAHAKTFLKGEKLDSSVLEKGVEQINAFLQKAMSKISTPAFCWCGSEEGHIGNLTAEELTVLVATLNAKAVAIEKR